MTNDQDRLATLNAALEAARLLRIERDALRQQVAAYEERFGPLDEGFASKVPLVHAAGISLGWPDLDHTPEGERAGWIACAAATMFAVARAGRIVCAAAVALAVAALALLVLQ